MGGDLLAKQLKIPTHRIYIDIINARPGVNSKCGLVEAKRDARQKPLGRGDMFRDHFVTGIQPWEVVCFELIAET